MLVDELVDGAKGAALPLIRHDLGLSYEQVGLLASVPLLVGGLLELPLGMLVGQGRRRRLAILGGGILFVLTLLGTASADSFAVLMGTVFTGFLALYLVDVAHMTPAVAALAIAIRLGAALAGDAALSAATAPWYPIVQARLYGSLPGRSSVAVTLSSVAGLAGGLGPLAVGLAAEQFGLSWALTGLVLVPVAVLLVPGRAGPRA